MVGTSASLSLHSGNLTLINYRKNAECGVRGVENEECGKCGVWKMRSVENVEHFNFNMKLTNHLIPLYSP